MVELAASLLLLMPATAPIGAFIAMGVMSGAIMSHLLVLGIDVKGDGGLVLTWKLIVSPARTLAWEQ